MRIYSTEIKSNFKKESEAKVLIFPCWCQSETDSDWYWYQYFCTYLPSSNISFYQGCGLFIFKHIHLVVYNIQTVLYFSNSSLSTTSVSMTSVFPSSIADIQRLKSGVSVGQSCWLPAHSHLLPLPWTPAGTTLVTFEFLACHFCSLKKIKNWSGSSQNLHDKKHKWIISDFLSLASFGPKPHKKSCT